MQYTVDFGLSNHTLENSIQYLETLLSNEYLLFTKTLNFHWNYQGTNFIGIHELLESQYEQLKELTDDVAERLRVLGGIAPVDLSDYKKEAALSEGDETEKADAMLRNLTESHESVIKIIRDAISAIEKTNDYATADFLTALLFKHEKMTWFLRSHILSK